jgi:predicted nucleic acid-binding protein
VIYIDTNALVSFLLPGRRQDHRVVADRIRDAGTVIVCESVLAETLWVLGRTYGVGRADASTLVRGMLDTEGIDAWDPGLADDALQLMSRSPSLSIVDCLLMVRARRDHVILTFDRDLARAIERS